MGSGQGGSGSGSAAQHIARLFSAGSLTGLSDGQLLERYLTHRDELAFAALVERHAAVVLSVCRRSLDDAADVEDAFQATFLVLARRARAVRDQKVLGSWLFGVARRVSLLANRAAARRKRHERRAAELRQTGSGAVVVNDERGPAIYEEIERLPSAYRLPVVLCLMEGRSRAEAADALRWTEGMVRGRLARARRLLRARLIRRGLAPAAAWAALARDGMAARGVPRGLIDQTARAAIHTTTSKLAAGSVSAAAMALTEGVLKIMLFKNGMLCAGVIVGAMIVAWVASAALVAPEEQAPATAAAPIAETPPGAIPLDDPGKSALHGRVLDPEGKPVAGARISARSPVQGQDHPSTEELAEARTDADGRFRLGPIAPLYRNRFGLIVDALHFARLSIPGSAVLSFPGLDCDLGNIQVDPGRVFRGQILDFDGKPLPAATIEPAVYRYQWGHTVGDIGPRKALTTDAEGRFRTPPLRQDSRPLHGTSRIYPLLSDAATAICLPSGLQATPYASVPGAIFWWNRGLPASASQM